MYNSQQQHGGCQHQNLAAELEIFAKLDTFPRSDGILPHPKITGKYIYIHPFLIPIPVSPMHR